MLFLVSLVDVLLEFVQYYLGLLVSACYLYGSQQNLGLGPWSLEAWGKRLLRSVSHFQWKTVLPMQGMLSPDVQKTFGFQVCFLRKSCRLFLPTIHQCSAVKLPRDVMSILLIYIIYIYICFIINQEPSQNLLKGQTTKKNPPPLCWRKESTTNGVAVMLWSSFIHEPKVLNSDYFRVVLAAISCGHGISRKWKIDHLQKDI